MNKSDLIRIADVIAKMFSPSVETVVHDMSKKKFPILAIYNNILSGRKVGDTTAIFGELDKSCMNPNEVVNYEFAAPNGKVFRSSSLLFRDEQDNPILALSINFDKEPIKAAIHLLSQFSDYVPEQVNLRSGQDKTFLDEQDLENEIMKVLIHYNKASLSRSDKQAVIQQLNQTDYFDHHKSITVLSRVLNITRPTIYKYLRSR